MLISFHGLSHDPYAEPYLDDLNRRLLESFSDSIFSWKKEGEWEVCVQM
ncbi:MAG: hypothetical protein IKP31_05045 [Lachnospiraceae bacterium]|nr:hypothetical protein [Lachnospiraceae bacterium]